MESDSDSDGSHISATPPRDSKRSPSPFRQPSFQPPPPPSALSNLISSHKSKPKHKLKPSSCHSKPQKPIAKPTAKPPSPKPSPPSPCALIPNLPFHICRPSDQIASLPTDGFVQPLRAGYFSRLASFSKIRKSSLDFEDDYPLPGVEVKSESADAEVTVKDVKKKKIQPPNLIGGQMTLPPVKLRKYGNDSNFVRLNLNFKKGKFANKGKRKNSYAANSSRRSYRYNKRKLNAKSEGETESIFEEDGLVTEFTQRNGKEELGRGKLEDQSTMEMVLAVKEDPCDENLGKLLKEMYGYNSFREGQLEAIKMVLDKKSVMLVLPTGAGKSLCYQMPAVLLPGITLVVSPLLALMIDQLKQLPPMISGGLLSSSQTSEEVAETLRLTREGIIKVLFVSPERFLNEEFLSIFSDSLSISLLVVDEAHCVSEWSHNFRPSYMRLRASLLRARLNVQCILAMTATATTTTLDAIMYSLEIPSENFIQKGQLRENLQLSVSMSGNRMKDLIKLIKSPPFTDVQSIIVYCKFQFETDQVSKYLCDNNISAKSYHSGYAAKDRRRIQELFCSNKIRVVVATVAFGMGLDKRDVGAVIHYSLPESLEEYVQEIGRAGRDGRLSYCHLFFDDITYFKLRSLMYSDGIDEYAINKFLCQVFTSENCHGICSLIKESASRKFDMKEEVMLTVLTQLELGEMQYLHLHPPLNVTCTLNFHKTPPVLLADRDIVVAAILKKSETKHGQYVFDIPTIANYIGVTSMDLSNQLQNLKGEVTYEMKDPAYSYTIVEDPKDICSLSSHLTKWLSEIESCKVRKLDAMFDAAVFAVNACEKVHGCHGAQHTPCLEKKILNYFMENDDGEVPNKMCQSSRFLRADIKVFLQSNSQAKFTPRAIARILHGIASPAYPSTTWSKTHFWGRYTEIDFQVVMEAAKAELMNFVGKDAL
ncbi:ATP-dependent DNA helicase Q-like 5 isoform X2 [Tripterygium wilfordii]|uniref:ATP-dependent DNA helicase Q-like 5 isoform X2 n=1 Tax=Tripterygium wilfordii TaxID=458696 RepID=UPI0018F7EBC9|nr:ATP-dependent DNA helicase Q-like 5 isoform X2 [Tripterygium wilfordii]